MIHSILRLAFFEFANPIAVVSFKKLRVVDDGQLVPLASDWVSLLLFILSRQIYHGASVLWVEPDRLAIRVYCAVHLLLLCVVKPFEVPEIRVLKVILGVTNLLIWILNMRNFVDFVYSSIRMKEHERILNVSEVIQLNLFENIKMSFLFVFWEFFLNLIWIFLSLRSRAVLFFIRYIHDNRGFPFLTAMFFARKFAHEQFAYCFFLLRIETFLLRNSHQLLVIQRTYFGAFNTLLNVKIILLRTW